MFTESYVDPWIVGVFFIITISEIDTRSINGQKLIKYSSLQAGLHLNCFCGKQSWFSGAKIGIFISKSHSQLWINPKMEIIFVLS